MEIIDLEWFGITVRIESDSLRFASLVRRLWGGLDPGGSSVPSRRYVVQIEGGERPALFGRQGSRPLDPREPLWHAYNALLDELLGEVHEHFLLHAASVGRGGEGLVVSGPTSFGKTTLSIHLTGRGFRLLSDDLTVIERASGRLLPCGRALNLRPGSRSTLPRAQVGRALRAVRGVEGDEWAVDPKLWLGPQAESSRIAVVAILRPRTDGAGLRRFPLYEIRILGDPEESAAEIGRLPGVTAIEADRSVPWALRVRVEDSGPTTSWLRAHRDRVVSVSKLPMERPDFNARPVLRPIGPFQAAVELAQEMLNRHDGSLVAEEFRGREALLVAEIAGLLKGARCYALHPGRLDETLHLLTAAFEEVAATP